jgi:hypothetical protein
MLLYFFFIKTLFLYFRRKNIKYYIVRITVPTVLMMTNTFVILLDKHKSILLFTMLLLTMINIVVAMLDHQVCEQRKKSTKNFRN